ncbi:type VII secretion target [Actinoplanes sp. NPDC020271]|uniref:type VII secretion target n=1 Tax=Actinoplanes sp. NPDC020271 TaxID=3363896 RepID=UPI0037930268
MNPDLDVDSQHLQDAASAVGGTASRVREAAGTSPPPVAGPRWAAVDATASVTDAAVRVLRDLSTALTDTAVQIKTTISAYADADARAATRLRAAQ